MHRSHVNLHVVLPTEALATKLAAERPCLEVNGGGVSIQAALLAELQAAVCAGKGPGLVVGARDVAIVAGDAGEALTAQAALDTLLWGLWLWLCLCLCL